MQIIQEAQHQLTHSDFDAALERTKKGKSILYVPTHTRTTKIDAKTIARWDKAGYPVIAKDKDGRGFRLGSGKSTVYVLPGQLWEVSI
jgi:hypothetical protein